jgi:hypothetical protein
MLHDWYVGALSALADESNPDRLAQAANSLREPLEKIPRALEKPKYQDRIPTC